METIKTQAVISDERRLSVQLSQELPTGDYDVWITLTPKSVNEAKTYPLRGLPVMISEDFDDPMPDLWDALSS
ncbi:MAG: hypothetical protein GC158_00450 [Cyanobacteria bacterium RI_101]|nr:hypothetical protein [Cyanobacteria bacterium RI_101]